MRLQTQMHLLKPGRALPCVPREPGCLLPLACCLVTTLRHASAGVFPQQLYCFCASGRYLWDDLVTCSGLFSDSDRTALPPYLLRSRKLLASGESPPSANYPLLPIHLGKAVGAICWILKSHCLTFPPQ